MARRDFEIADLHFEEHSQELPIESSWTFWVKLQHSVKEAITLRPSWMRCKLQQLGNIRQGGKTEN